MINRKTFTVNRSTLSDSLLTLLQQFSQGSIKLGDIVEYSGGYKEMIVEASSTEDNLPRINTRYVERNAWLGKRIMCTSYTLTSQGRIDLRFSPRLTGQESYQGDLRNLEEADLA